ncbi:short transient receptor potential channel 4-like [Amphiura filiformis]|uniref:short transient receptor potential channel 4-like n=1 Tax=Amphiura filiformis TaxID=82378 RepID=UPI003B21E87E
MAMPPTLVTEYFSAIVENDIEIVQELLDGCDGENAVDIDAVASDGSTALQVALEHKYYELGDKLINRRIKGGLTLLRMIEVDNPKAVEYLCKKHKDFKSNREDIFSSRTSDDEFPPETTPVTLAARLNRYEILKILMQYGAIMPTLDEVRRQFSNKRPGRERAILQLCEARASEAYLLQTSQDILSNIFRLTQELQDIRREEKNSLEKLGCRDEYTDLEERLRIMAEKVVDYTNAEELETLLKGTDAERSAPQVAAFCGKGQSQKLPIRIAQALQLRFKELIAHKKLQEWLWRQWRYGFSQHIDRSHVRRILVTTLFFIFWPIFSVLYLLLSGFTFFEPFVRILKTPYVKFILHASSRVSFLFILILRGFVKQPAVFVLNISNDTLAETDTIRQDYIAYKSHAYTIPGLIFLWIAGMTWRELTRLRDQGAKMYMDVGSSLVDVPQIFLYWIYLIFASIAHTQAGRVVSQAGWLKKVTSAMSVTMICDSEPSTSSNCTSIYEESRFDWHSHEPILIAEAAFAVANVFTFVRLLDITVLIAGLGALQVSFKKMFRPIFKFLALFSFVWLSFSLGTTQLYRSFEDAMLELCEHNHRIDETHDCPDNEPHFTTLWISLTSYFWMLFGQGGLNYFSLPHNLRFTEDIGWLIYALWHIAVVMFLMKILIGLTSSVYAKIERNADMEWKFARTKMVSEYMMDTAVVPPPFNIVPSTASIVRCCKTILNAIDQGRTVTDEVELERRRTKTIRLEERQQKKAIRLTHNYKMISGIVRRRYARSVMKSQHKIAPPREKTQRFKAQQQETGSGTPDSSEDIRRIQKTCDSLASDLKDLQQTIDTLVKTLQDPRTAADEST